MSLKPGLLRDSGIIQARRKTEALNEQTRKIYADIEAARVAELEGAVSQANKASIGVARSRTLLGSLFEDGERPTRRALKGGV